MSCASCGRANRAGARFCGGCGRPLAPRCPACGSESDPGARFCDACGASLVARADGYALRLEPSTETSRDALEWFLLEHRCCPFLRLEVVLEPGPGPLWLRLSGGPGVKEFLAEAPPFSNGRGSWHKSRPVLRIETVAPA